MKERELNEVWYGDRTGSWILQPLARIYGAVIRLRWLAYLHGWLRVRSVNKPVIIVGNLTVGGAGKTPLVAWLATELTARGLTVGIASRGYGRSERTPRFVNTDSSWRDVGDEPVLLQARTGCLTVVGADRVAAAKALIAKGVDVILSDDGLQHVRLGRDCELVVMDGQRGFGNGHLLPAGPLREPVARLQSVDALVINGALPSVDAKNAVVIARALRDAAAISIVQMTLESIDARHVADREPPRPLESFVGKRVHAVAGIGNPARFFQGLVSRGIQVVEHPFPDHHPFTAADLDFGDALPVLMTEKDAVKCRAFDDSRLWYVPVTARFSESHARELLEHVVRKIAGHSGAQG